MYDVTTCKSLGLEVDSFGNLTLEGAEDKGDVDRIHLEAVTDAIFKQIKAEKAQEQQANTASADANANGDEPEVEQPHEESLIRLVLKANKQGDFKLKVKPVSCEDSLADLFTTNVRRADYDCVENYRCFYQEAFARGRICLFDVRWRTTRSEQ